METRMIIAIAGGTGSGKTTAANFLADYLGRERVTIMAIDDYYRSQPGTTLEERAKMNYDHPESLDLELLAVHLEGLKRGEEVVRPVYDFANHDRSEQTVKIAPTEIVIVEGILALADENLRSKYTMTIYMDEPADIRFIRRLKRDTKERGRSVESVIGQYLTTVRPMHEQFVEPTKLMADYVEGELRKVVAGV